MQSNLTVNKYLHTVASRWISSTYNVNIPNLHFCCRYYNIDLNVGEEMIGTGSARVFYMVYQRVSNKP